MVDSQRFGEQATPGDATATAVVLTEPNRLQLRQLGLDKPGPADLVVDIEHSGISTGTERLLYQGRMPHFPGMGYPLVPGYESVGEVVQAGPESGHRVGETVFVPGAKCFGDVRGLFGGAASRVVLPGSRAITLPKGLGEHGVLFALAATAYHAVAMGGRRERIVAPDLIVGHGVLGRLLARLTVAAGLPAPTVWESNPERRDHGAAAPYPVIAPEADERRDYRAIYDVSGDATLLDSLIQRLGHGGEIVLAGFYSQPLSLSFPPAFMREASIRVAAEWQRPDLLAVRQLIDEGRFSLDGLVTHRLAAQNAQAAYDTAFNDPHCLKMVLNWRTMQ
jgi:3-hydroxyethyl bacteriochlorophyllide a dehydrogenase